MTDMCTPIAYDFLLPWKKEIKLYYNGRLTPEGKGRWQLPQGSVLSCREKVRRGRGEGGNGSDKRASRAVAALAKMAYRLSV